MPMTCIGPADNFESCWSRCIVLNSELEVRHLRALVALVDHGSITASAHALGVAQSTVSETLAALERVIGASVFVRRRGTRGVTLTATGQALLPHARQALSAVDQAHFAAASISRKVRSSISIGANESVSTYLLPSALSVIRERWPKTRFGVTVDGCSEILEGVADGKFDVGVHLELPVRAHLPANAALGIGSDVRLVALADAPLVVFCAPSHPLLRRQQGGVVSLSQLAAFPTFVSEARGGLRDLLAACLNDGSMTSARLEGAGSIEGVKRSVERHPEAIGILPSYALTEEFHRLTFRPLATTAALPVLRLEGVVSARHAVHPAANELLAALRQGAPADARAS